MMKSSLKVGDFVEVLPSTGGYYYTSSMKKAIGRVFQVKEINLNSQGDKRYMLELPVLGLIKSTTASFIFPEDLLKKQNIQKFAPVEKEKTNMQDSSSSSENIKVGDFVEILPSAGQHYTRTMKKAVGKVFEVKRINLTDNGDEDYLLCFNKDDDSGFSDFLFSRSSLRKVEKPDDIKVGDFVEVLPPSEQRYTEVMRKAIGQVFEVQKVNRYHTDERVRDYTLHIYGFIDKHKYVTQYFIPSSVRKVEKTPDKKIPKPPWSDLFILNQKVPYPFSFNSVEKNMSKDPEVNAAKTFAKTVGSLGCKLVKHQFRYWIAEPFTTVTKKALSTVRWIVASTVLASVAAGGTYAWFNPDVLPKMLPTIKVEAPEIFKG